MSSMAPGTGKNMGGFSSGGEKDRLISDFNTVVTDTEALVKATANQGGEKIAELRAKAEESLRAVKSTLADAQAELLVKTKAAAKATDDYVRDNPWKAVGAATAVGLVIGVLIARR
jgi:ElaB/YqjD/DUF883 family membrane-anchored ribosome-binding protein